MQLDGLKSNGPIGPDKGAAQRKADPKAIGKSFADVLTKAKQASKPAQGSGPAQLHGTVQPKTPTQASAPTAGAGHAASPTRLPAGDAAAPEASATKHAEPKASQEATPSAQEYLETIRFRLKTGYYDNPKVDDALSDKLSGYFDEAAE
jgi:hypothetical protein